MVAIPATIRSLGTCPVVCLARPLLHAAACSLDRGDVIAAGCQLREATRLFLVAECEYWACLPLKSRDLQSPLRLAKKLRRRGQCGESAFATIAELVDIGNKLAHCQPVCRRELVFALTIAYELLDGSPYLVQPTAAGRLS